MDMEKHPYASKENLLGFLASCPLFANLEKQAL